MTPSDDPLPGMVGRHPCMLDVYRLVRRYAPTRLPVAIVGETGTGKELVARAIHDLGGYSKGPFVAINCATLPEQLAEGELFGWERGAFTGAAGSRLGLLEAAHGGTLFLDEACSLTPFIQAKLLRAIEQQEYRRLGAQHVRRSAFRLVVALSEPLEQLLNDRRLRPDFVFRVSTVVIRLTPLRDRASDLPQLANHFLAAANQNGHPNRVLSAEASALLARHSWPGNVRELKAVMERIEAEGEGRAVLPEHVVRQFAAPLVRALTPGEALVANGWNVTKTAKALGIARSTVYQYIRKAGISRPLD